MWWEFYVTTEEQCEVLKWSVLFRACVKSERYFFSVEKLLSLKKVTQQSRKNIYIIEYM